MADRERTNRWFQFSLAALLFITLCVCGYFAGYRRGFTAGKVDRDAANMYVTAYTVADLIVPRTGADTPPRRTALGDQLIDLIVDTVETESWKEHGAGDGEIQWYESNQCIVASQTGRVHAKIAGPA